jgi:uncharacterized protein YjbJ (UPF0337 family)
MHGSRAEVQVVMGTENIKREATGAAQTVVGRIKRAVGRLFGSRRAQVEGGAEELRGRANVAAGKAGERIEEAAKETAGRAKELEGRARQELNR